MPMTHAYTMTQTILPTEQAGKYAARTQNNNRDTAFVNVYSGSGQRLSNILDASHTSS